MVADLTATCGFAGSYDKDIDEYTCTRNCSVPTFDMKLFESTVASGVNVGSGEKTEYVFVAIFLAFNS